MKTIEQLKTDLAAATKEKADADAALVVAEKQKAEAEKKRVDAEAGFITLVISGAGGLVSKCRIPIAAVAQLGLFRILCGVTVTNITYNAPVDIPSYLRNVPLYKGDYYPIPGGAGGAHYHTEAVERYNNCSDAGHLDTATGGPPFTKMDATDVKKMEALRMCWELFDDPIVNYHSTMNYESGITDVTAKYGQGEDITPTQSHFWEGPLELPTYQGSTGESGRVVQGLGGQNPIPFNTKVWE
jgi:hypothetical protein